LCGVAHKDKVNAFLKPYGVEAITYPTFTPLYFSGETFLCVGGKSFTDATYAGGSVMSYGEFNVGLSARVIGTPAVGPKAEGDTFYFDTIFNNQQAKAYKNNNWQYGGVMGTVTVTQPFVDGGTPIVAHPASLIVRKQGVSGVYFLATIGQPIDSWYNVDFFAQKVNNMEDEKNQYFLYDITPGNVWNNGLKFNRRWYKKVYRQDFNPAVDSYYVKPGTELSQALKQIDWQPKFWNSSPHIEEAYYVGKKLFTLAP